MAKFSKRPVVVDAERLTEPVTIETREGVLFGNAGDWLITDVYGERYPCQHDVFVATYEPYDPVR